MHNSDRPEMIILATIASAFANAIALSIIAQSKRTQGAQRRDSALLAGLILGFGSWSGHFLTVLGYGNSYIAGYSAALTTASLVVGICSAQMALYILLHANTLLGRLVAGSLVAMGLAAMHYIATSALRVPATLKWDWLLVAVSIIVPVLMICPALIIVTKARQRWDIAAAIAIMCVAVSVMHNIGTEALSFIPSKQANGGATVQQSVLAAWICVFSLATLAISGHVHKRRQTVHATRQLKDLQFAKLIGGTSDYAICMLDRQGIVALWNAGAHALIGYDAEEATGLPFSSFFNEADCQAGRPQNALLEALQDGIAKGEWACKRKDGSEFWAHGSVEKLCDDNGQHIGFSIITRDVSEIRQAQDALAITSGQLDTAIENMHQGLCMFDRDEKLLLSNAAFFNVWSILPEHRHPGISLTEFVEAGYFSIGHTPAETLERIRRSVRQARANGGNPARVMTLRGDLILAVSERPVPDGGWIVTCEDITGQRRIEARIAHMAMHDALTGLPNRTQFYHRLDLMIEKAEPTDNIAVVVIDLDRFKEINDTFGHASGDHVLRVLAERFMACRRDGEAIARLGGDEFAATVSFTRKSELNEFIARIQACIASPILDEGHPLMLGASLGIAVYPNDALSRETLLNNADLAMYRAKGNVGESVCFFEAGMDETARYRRWLAADLKQAIARDELSVMYQPQHSLHTGAVIGYEALLRWTHPLRGPISPAEFIPIAEENGDIIQLGEWVLRQACAEACAWPGEEKVAVNLSPVQFLQRDLVSMVRSVLMETGLPASRLELEITETAIIHDKLRALHCLRQIKAMGTSVAIDDFGTGYSSLDTLQSFPFDKIKIDKSFLLKSEGNAQARAIIRAVLALGKSLSIPVLAEGVETESQLRVLEAEGCDEAQGFYFGRPSPAPSLEISRTMHG